MINSCLNGSLRPTHRVAPGEFLLQRSEKSSQSLLLTAAPTQERVTKSLLLQKCPSMTASTDTSTDAVDQR